MRKDSIITGSNHNVYIDGKLLDPRLSQAYRNHSPDGFSWGYSGSGPSQLALALLLEVCLDKDQAQAHYQDFKFDVVAGLDETFTLNASVIYDWCEKNI